MGGDLKSTTRWPVTYGSLSAPFSADLIRRADTPSEYRRHLPLPPSAGLRTMLGLVFISPDKDSCKHLPQARQKRGKRHFVASQQRLPIRAHLHTIPMPPPQNQAPASHLRRGLAVKRATCWPMACGSVSVPFSADLVRRADTPIGGRRHFIDFPAAICRSTDYTGDGDSSVQAMTMIATSSDHRTNKSGESALFVKHPLKAILLDAYCTGSGSAMTRRKPISNELRSLGDSMTLRLTRQRNA